MIKCFTWIYNRIKSHIFAESGVSTDIWTSYAARMMVISVIPFLIVQIPQLLNSTSGRHLAVLIALIVAVLLLISYCLYQVQCAYNYILFAGQNETCFQAPVHVMEYEPDSMFGSLKVLVFLLILCLASNLNKIK